MSHFESQLSSHTSYTSVNSNYLLHGTSVSSDKSYYMKKFWLVNATDYLIENQPVIKNTKQKTVASTKANASL